MRKRWNCKDGLNVVQERIARKIRKELLTEEGKEKYYRQLRALFEKFNDLNCGDILLTDFEDEVKFERPELHSAFRRLGIDMEMAIENFLKY